MWVLFDICVDASRVGVQNGTVLNYNRCQQLNSKDFNKNIERQRSRNGLCPDGWLKLHSTWMTSASQRLLVPEGWGRFCPSKIIRNYNSLAGYFLASWNSVWKMLKCIPLVHNILPWESMSGQHFGKANQMFLVTIILKSTYSIWLLCA